MSTHTLTCPHCRLLFFAKESRVNRAAKIGAPLYCGVKCACAARRVEKTITERKEEKRQYDAKRRAEKADEIKAAKREYHRKTYEPTKAALERKKRAPYHAEYCRSPEYRAYKSQYDRRHRAQRLFGEFAEVAILLQDVEHEIDQRATRYEIYMANGTINKAQSRRRSI